MLKCDMCHKPLKSKRHQIVRGQVTLTVGPDCFKKEKEAAARLKAQEEASRQEREKYERQVAAQRAKEESDRKAAEELERKAREKAEAAAKKEREALAAKAKTEKEAREKAEAELRAKREAEEKAARLAAEDAERKASLPDKAKLSEFADRLGNIELPKLATNRYGKFMESIRLEIMQIVSKVEQEASKP